MSLKPPQPPDSVLVTAGLQGPQGATGPPGPTGGQAPPGWFVVTDPAYGAVGDGVTDDRAAIQAAIDACKAASGGTVYFPPGVYLIGQSGGLGLQMDTNYWGVNLVGAGMRSWANGWVTQLKHAATTGGILRGRSQHSVTIEGIEFVATNASYAGKLVDLSSTGTDPQFISVKRCRFRYSGGGTGETFGLAFSRNIVNTIRECQFDGFKYNLTFGFEAYTVANQVEHCMFNNGPDNGWHIYVPFGALESIGINFNTFEPRGALGSCDAIFCANGVNSDGFTAIGNWFGDYADVPSSPAITLTPRGGLIAANKFGYMGTGVAAIALHGGNGCAVIGNQFQSDYGIDFIGGAGSSQGVYYAANSFNGAQTFLRNTANANDIASSANAPNFRVGGPGAAAAATVPVHTSGDLIAFGSGASAAPPSSRSSAVIYRDITNAGDLVIQPATDGAGKSVRFFGGNGTPTQIMTIDANGMRTGRALTFDENASPPAAITDACVLYTKDNGSGKTQLMARFVGGDVQVAIQP